MARLSMNRNVLIVLVLLCAPLAGCVNGGEPLAPANGSPSVADRAGNETLGPSNATGSNATEESPNATDANGTRSPNATGEQPQADPLANVTVDDDRVEVDVPVHVALVGFPETTTRELSDQLEPFPVDQRTYDNPAPIHPEDTPPTVFPDRTTRPNPVLPVANYTVHRLPALADELADRRPAWTVSDSGNTTIYDADRVERFLTDRLPEHGVPVDERPTLVLLHDGSPGDHAYRYGYPAGYLEPVRAFGGNSPLLVLDVSARQDPWVTTDAGICVDTDEPAVEVACDLDAESYNYPQKAGEGVVETLVNATHNATRFRLLQGPLYPPTTQPCYAVTAVVGIESTALTEHAPSTPSAEELVDEAKLRAALANVTGPMEVHLDTRVLRLPQDAPGLAAVAETEDPTAVRLWLTEHWSDYWVAHDGCEAAVSFHLIGDATQAWTWGIAMRDAERGYRVSFSVTAGLERLARTYEGPGAQAAGGERESSPGYELVDHLVGHETGHLLGLRHPHDVSPNGDESRDGLVWTFSSTRTSMSYQVGDRIAGYGDVDRRNLLRNRAGELARTALQDGLGEEPGFEDALVEVGEGDWVEANRALEALLSSTR